ncbi:MAG TPA: hypothetical protein VGJ70_23955 [Solirubrobacteraceae bacterium]|jgi:hypothetical protein
MQRLKTHVLLGVLALLLALPGVAQARTNVRVSIADQSQAMFDAPAYRSLKLKTTRFFIRWDAIRSPADIARADAYVRRARAAHVRVLMHISTNDFTPKRAHLPSVAEYRRTVGALVRHYRKLGVRDWGAWNEVNHKTQPTWNSPKRAAQYFTTMRALCRGCTIVALDILDQAGATRYIQRFYRALGSKRRFARIVGIHNYSDTNRAVHRGRGTRSIILAVRSFNRRTQFWLTETGGVVNFGRSFPCNEQRAAKSVSRMFGLARSYRRYIKRLYVYNWTGSDCNGFDTGLTKANGQLRPAYYTLRKYLKSFRR